MRSVQELTQEGHYIARDDKTHAKAQAEQEVFDCLVHIQLPQSFQEPAKVPCIFAGNADIAARRMDIDVRVQDFDVDLLAVVVSDRYQWYLVDPSNKSLNVFECLP